MDDKKIKLAEEAFVHMHKMALFYKRRAEELEEANNKLECQIERLELSRQQYEQSKEVIAGQKKQIDTYLRTITDDIDSLKERISAGNQNTLFQKEITRAKEDILADVSEKIDKLQDAVYRCQDAAIQRDRPILHQEAARQEAARQEAGSAFMAQGQPERKVRSLDDLVED